MIWLLLACVDPAPRQVRSPPGDDSGPTDSGGHDTAEDTGEDTDTAADPDAAVVCETLSDARARCTVTDAWAYDPADAEAGVWTYLSPELEPGIGFDGAILSWNTVTPAGATAELGMAVRVDGAWSGFYNMGVWRTSGDRSSVDGQSDSFGTVYTDTLYTRSAADAVRLRLRLTGEGSSASRLVIAVADTSNDRRGLTSGVANGVHLGVTERSQMEFDEGAAWCSPTSTSMLLDFHGVSVTVPEAAEGTWDSVYEGNGNWPFNMAYAASLGRTAEVGWFDSLTQIEAEIAAGRPVGLSVAWDAGDITGAAISSTAGHLLVVDGFTSSGDVEVNDPAASTDQTVSRVYLRDELEAAWLDASGGVVYRMW